MNKSYINHLIDCHCILKIYQNIEKHVYHKFIVFSELEDDNFKKKYVECNNCGSIHEVTNINKSNIMSDSTKYKALVTSKEDLHFNLPEKYVSFLVKNKVQETYIWENINYLLENNLEGSIIYNKESIDGNVICNFININNKGNFSIKKEIFQRDLK
tara:strand:- start:373 stop:843 length:471 start_codon:yes stop_codon:yes gene_type:complete